MMKLNKDWKNSKKKMPEDSYKTILARMTVRGGAIQKVEYLPVLLDDDSNPHLVKQEDTAFLEIVRYMEENHRKSGNFHPFYCRWGCGCD